MYWNIYNITNIWPGSKINIKKIANRQVTREELAPLVEALNRDSIPSHLASESTFVCKLCKAFCGVKVSLKINQTDSKPMSISLDINLDILIPSVTLYMYLYK